MGSTQNDLAAPANSSGYAPIRKPNSVRRTSSIDVTWPAGQGASMHVSGQARDIYTGSQSGSIQLLRCDAFTATLSPERVINEISSNPPRPELKQLLNTKCGSAFRKALVDALHQEQLAGTPLYFLLDDLAGTSLIATWAWTHWGRGGKKKAANQVSRSANKIELEALAQQAHIERFQNVCTGFSRDSNALLNFYNIEQNCQKVAPLLHPDDPLGWHHMPLHRGVSMRRARRIDMWQEDHAIQIDAMFQDSASAPDGSRSAVHEYTLQLEVNSSELTITSLKAEPRVLPYKECPAAAANIGRLKGAPIQELRTVVLEKLQKQEGCTHLNDALRSLAELPTLLTQIKND